MYFSEKKCLASKPAALKVILTALSSGIFSACFTTRSTSASFLKLLTAFLGNKVKVVSLWAACFEKKKRNSAPGSLILCTLKIKSRSPFKGVDFYLDQVLAEKVLKDAAADQCP